VRRFTKDFSSMPRAAIAARSESSRNNGQSSVAGADAIELTLGELIGDRQPENGVIRILGIARG
jgi:hypothetical protein